MDALVDTSRPTPKIPAFLVFFREFSCFWPILAGPAKTGPEPDPVLDVISKEHYLNPFSGPPKMTPFWPLFWTLFGPLFDHYWLHTYYSNRVIGSNRGPNPDPYFDPIFDPYPGFDPFLAPFLGPVWTTKPMNSDQIRGSFYPLNWPFFDPFFDPYLTPYILLSLGILTK